MFSIFTAAESSLNDSAEGFCNYWEDQSDASYEIFDWCTRIPQLSSQTVLVNPLSGILG